MLSMCRYICSNMPSKLKLRHCRVLLVRQPTPTILGKALGDDFDQLQP